MTYLEEEEEEDDGGTITEVDPIIHTRDQGGGDYVKLRCDEPHDSHPEEATPSSPPTTPLWYWFKIGLFVLCFGILSLVVFQWVGPFFIQKVFIPIITWERKTFSPSQLAVVVFASIALFPILFLPSSPSMWLAGMTFNYIFGFLLVISAAAVGVSLPFFIGSNFHRKIDEWLDKYPAKASVLRSAGRGDWFHQFRAVALIRISPFPYIIYNYASVVTNVNYGPYLLGSLVGMVPEIVASIYTGVLIRALVDVSHKPHTLSTLQVAVNVVGFCISLATMIIFTFYGMWRLKELRKEDELLLQ